MTGADWFGEADADEGRWAPRHVAAVVAALAVVVGGVAAAVWLGVSR